MSSPVAYAFLGRRISLLNPVDKGNGESPIHVPAHVVVGRTSKIYSCGQCSRVFTTSGHLSRHNRIHTGAKGYACPFPSCGRDCSRSDNLVQHFRVHLPKNDRGCGNSHIRLCMEQLRTDLEAQGDSGYAERPYASTSFEEQVFSQYVVLRRPKVHTAALHPASPSSPTMFSDRSIELSPTSTVSTSGFSLSAGSPFSSPVAASDGSAKQTDRLRMEDDRHPHKFLLEANETRPNRNLGPRGLARDQPAFGKPVFEESFMRGGAA